VRDPVLRVPRRTLAITAGVALIVVAMALLMVTGVLARVTDPSTVAAAPVIATHQAAVERDVERAYELAVAQVRKVRSLNLAISAQQADTIAAKASTDLLALRHSAFVAVGQLLSMSATDAESYATATEQRFNQTPLSAQPAPSPVLLAPRLYAIVSKMSEVATQISDKATTDLTAPAPTGTPTPAPTPSGTRTPSPSPTPSASPSR
jgi:hypothetical protein